MQSTAQLPHGSASPSFLVPAQRNDTAPRASADSRNACSHSREAAGYQVIEPNIRKDTKAFETVNECLMVTKWLLRKWKS